MKSNSKNRERVVYRIGRNLIITNHRIKKRKKVFSLVEVKDHGLLLQKRSKIPSILLILLGILGLTQINSYGSYIISEGTIFNMVIPGMEHRSLSLSQDLILQMVCIGLILLGLSLLWILRNRYAVVIETSRGISKLVSFTKKRRAVQVELALHEAILYMPTVLFKKAQGIVGPKKKVPQKRKAFYK